MDGVDDEVGLVAVQLYFMGCHRLEVEGFELSPVQVRSEILIIESSQLARERQAKARCGARLSNEILKGILALLHEFLGELPLIMSTSRRLALVILAAGPPGRRRVHFDESELGGFRVELGFINEEDLSSQALALGWPADELVEGLSSFVESRVLRGLAEDVRNGDVDGHVVLERLHLEGLNDPLVLGEHVLLVEVISDNLL
mmetsp:Transcript_29356/g.44261  ORF Transcript_29356/g.44261 Transcript_29356/m.44261 type:complete len:202 (+) Transcript_29356:4900-5505(+)